jgi:hypothetical protein
MLVATSGMVSVGMGDHRTLDRSPWINIKITHWTIKSLGSSFNKRLHQKIALARSSVNAKAFHQ